MSFPFSPFFGLRVFGLFYGFLGFWSFPLFSFFPSGFAVFGFLGCSPTSDHTFSHWVFNGESLMYIVRFSTSLVLGTRP